MNARTSKLLRRWSNDSGVSENKAKTLWNDTPKNKRGSLRFNLLKQIAETPVEKPEETPVETPAQ